MKNSVGSGDLLSIQRESLPAKVAYGASRLSDDQCAGGHIPRIEIFLPVYVKSPAGDAAQIQRRAAHSPDALGAAHHQIDVFQIVVRLFLSIVCESRRGQRLAERIDAKRQQLRYRGRLGY